MEKNQSLVDWIEKGDPEICRPCLLAPLAAWYADALVNNGDQPKAQKLQQQLDDPSLTGPTAAKILDDVRQNACSEDGKLCDRLSELNETLFINAEALG